MEQRQTFRNSGDRPIYVSVEPWPECFELVADEELLLIWHAETSDQGTLLEIPNATEIVVWPAGDPNEIQFIIDGKPAEDRSWKFKHR